MTQTAVRPNGAMNKLDPTDRAAHDWYRFVLSFPPHLVAEYLRRFELGHDANILDPFCGTGTTLVESKKHGIPSVGIEANPVACFASAAKTHWAVDAEALVRDAERIADQALRELRDSGVDDEQDCSDMAGSLLIRRLPAEQAKLLLRNSISPLPLHKALVLRDAINSSSTSTAHERLAFADVLVFSISNLEFGPEVGVGAPKPDAPVIGPWLAKVKTIASDIAALKGFADVPSRVYAADARESVSALGPESVDAIITSPPYPNEKDYTRTTRLESVLLGFLGSRADLRSLKRSLVRSNTRGVYKADDDDAWVARHPRIGEIAGRIEARRIELGKTSGFERMYPRVTTLYFGGMARHLAGLRRALRPGAQLAYVVGDQASYLRVLIRTGELLAEIAERLGYQVEGLDLFRTRLATATKEQLREEVLRLRWPGGDVAWS